MSLQAKLSVASSIHITQVAKATGKFRKILFFSDFHNGTREKVWERPGKLLYLTDTDQSHNAEFVFFLILSREKLSAHKNLVNSG